VNRQCDGDMLGLAGVEKEQPAIAILAIAAKTTGH
jgi:hypothetical protein